MTDQNLPDDAKPVPTNESAVPAKPAATPTNESAVPAEKEAPKKAEISMGRIAIWVCVTGVALYLIISGVVGIVAKGS